MITVTEPQVWTIIGVMATSLIGVITLTTTAFTRVIKAEISGLHHRFDGVDRRLDSVEKHIDNLDRDVQFLMRRQIEHGN